MKQVLTTRVGEDGVLTVTVPLGMRGANQTVRVTVETVQETTGPAPAARAAWLRFLERTGGSITDPTFERQSQGAYEERDPLS